MSNELDFVMDVVAWTVYLSSTAAAIFHDRFIKEKNQGLAKADGNSGGFLEESAGSIVHSGKPLMAIGIIQLAAVGVFLAQDSSNPFNITAAVACLIMAGLSYKIFMAQKQLAAVSFGNAQGNSAAISTAHFAPLFHSGAHLAIIVFAAYYEACGKNSFGILGFGILVYWACWRYEKNRMERNDSTTAELKNKSAVDKTVVALFFLAVGALLWGDAIEAVLKESCGFDQSNQPADPSQPGSGEEPPASSALLSFLTGPVEKPAEQAMGYRIAMA